MSYYPQNAPPLSCDRCRKQKLRCPRSVETSSEDCTRCVRARITCVTSTRRRVGRPSTKSSPTGQVQPVPARATDDLFNGLFEDSTKLSQAMRESASTESFLDSLFLDGAGIPTPFSTVTDLSVSGASFADNNCQISIPESYRTAFNPSKLAVETAVSESRRSEDQCALNFASPTGTPTSIERAVAPDNPTRLGGNTKEPTNLSEVLIALSSLSTAIATQVSWREVISTFGDDQYSAVQECADSLQDAEGNPFVNILQNTHQLAQILSKAKSAIDHPSLGDHLVMPIIWTAFSIYTQILYIFNFMLANALRVLQSVPHPSVIFDKMPPRPLGGGVPPIGMQLYIKIMVQVLEEHLGGVETALNIPSDMSVSKKAVSSTNEVFSLISQAMKHDPGGHGQSGASLASSLRTQMQDVSRLADT